MTLVEMMVGVGLLALTVIVASALFPVSAFLRSRSGTYSQAAALVQRKVEQVRKLEAKAVNYDGLRAAGIIDESPSPPYSFNSVDNVPNELPGGSGSIELSGVGTDLVTVRIVVGWQASQGPETRVEATTYIANKEIWRIP